MHQVFGGGREAAARPFVAVVDKGEWMMQHVVRPFVVAGAEGDQAVDVVGVVFFIFRGVKTVCCVALRNPSPLPFDGGADEVPGVAE